MENFALVKCLEAFDNLDKNSPNFCFGKESACFLMLGYFLIDVASVSIVHDQTQRRGSVFEKYLSVANHVGVSGGLKQAYSMLARMRTSLRAFSFSLAESLPIFT